MSGVPKNASTNCLSVTVFVRAYFKDSRRGDPSPVGTQSTFSFLDVTLELSQRLEGHTVRASLNRDHMRL
jgi:hypothetical protein